jgi:hypothetical protein
VIELGKIIVVSDVQSEKQHSPSEVIELGKVIEVRDVHS